MKKLFMIFILLCASTIVLGTIKDAVKSADVHRTEYIEEGTTPLYLGNGRFGGCFDQSGLQYNAENEGNLRGKFGATTLMHIQHHARGKFGMDYLLPVARLYWDKPLEDVRAYSQHQSYYDGTIETSYESKDGPVSVTVWFDSEERNLFCAKIDADVMSDYRMVVEIPDKISSHYGSPFSQKIDFTCDSKGWKAIIRRGTEETVCRILTNAEGSFEDGKLFLRMLGKCYLIIAYNQEVDTDIDKSLARTKKWWHSKWQNNAFVEVPDEKVQKFYIRQQAQLYCTINDEALGLMPPCGLSGNAWPFPFPQDLSYILSACLANGEWNVAKVWIEKIAADVPEIRKYTMKLFGIEGVFSPWVYPYEGLSGYQDSGVPNRSYYEIHNAGHLCRMALEASIFVNDNRWTKKYAYPIIAGCAEFYRNMLCREVDGMWHIFHIPSMGQDENGGGSQKDYLDALYSAQYCFSTAVSCGLDTDGFYKRVLEEGLAFPSLKSTSGLFYSCHGRGERDFGKQKHPVQLSEIVFLPQYWGISKEAAKAYELRYEITERADEPFSRGWTNGTFILASSRMGNAEGWLRDWNCLLPSYAVDDEMIMFYESSSLRQKAYFTTNSGLFVNSILNCAVCDWTGEIVIGGCLPWKGRVSFSGIYSKQGVVISGTIENNKKRIVLNSWKDCDIVVDGMKVSMKEGERKKLEYSGNFAIEENTKDEMDLEMVDLGLSVKWGATNLGAISCEDSGKYLAWATAYDSVPEGYKLPSEEQWHELIDSKKCHWEYCSHNNVNGYKVTSLVRGYEGAWIFLPSCGCYIGSEPYSVGRDGFFWTSSADVDEGDSAMSVYTISGHVYMVNTNKYFKQSVRLVQDKQ